jgi:hypothetical protein
MGIEGTWSIDVRATGAETGVIDLRAGAVIQPGQPTGSYSESADGKVVIQFAYDGGKDGSRIEGNWDNDMTISGIMISKTIAPEDISTPDDIAALEDAGDEDNELREPVVLRRVAE